MKVLLADGDHEFRDTVRKFFEGTLCEISYAYNIDVALQIMKENTESRFDFVVVSWSLPHESGERLVKTIRRFYVGQRVWVTYPSVGKTPEKIGTGIFNDLLKQNINRYNIFPEEELIPRLKSELDGYLQR